MASISSQSVGALGYVITAGLKNMAADLCQCGNVENSLDLICDCIKHPGKRQAALDCCCFFFFAQRIELCKTCVQQQEIHSEVARKGQVRSFE